MVVQIEKYIFFVYLYWFRHWSPVAQMLSTGCKQLNIAVLVYLVYTASI